MADPEFYVANTSGFIHVGDTDEMITKGQTIVRKGDALLKAAPAFFEPLESSRPPAPEQATAAPGEKRGR